ncbi:MAG TPA: hypothetical protein VNK52_09535, partial [Hyphomicrobiaceae bacterium]|nr:hypothetical protein [Hyphomicrobiaceae bacterium]
LCVIVPTSRFNERVFESIKSCLTAAAARLTMLSGARRLPVPVSAPARARPSQPRALVRRWEPASSMPELKPVMRPPEEGGSGEHVCG